MIIDEVEKLNPDEVVTKEDKQLKEECQLYISKIARLGAGIGYSIPNRGRYPAPVQDGTVSRIVLGREGAELLTKVKGRTIYQTADERTV